LRRIEKRLLLNQLTEEDSLLERDKVRGSERGKREKIKSEKALPKWRKPLLIHGQGGSWDSYPGE